MTVRLILYSKPGCHLCEGLLEKLAQLDAPAIAVEVRDITTRDEWWTAYQYQIPVLCYCRDDREIPLPRPSPRAAGAQLQRWLANAIANASG